MVAPFTCPECSREGWRDRITLARHYAFAHNKLFEMTDVTPEMLNMSNMNPNMELKKFVRKQSDEDVANQNNHVKVKQNKEDPMLEEEDLKLKESVAALSVKSDSNFVQWQKSFGKHDAPSGKKGKNREGETKEERRERKEKRRAERKEAERREASRWEKEKQQVVGKPPLSLMMQELDNSNSWSVKEGERKKVKKEEESDDEYADLPQPVYACKPDCCCSFHF